MSRGFSINPTVLGISLEDPLLSDLGRQLILDDGGVGQFQPVNGRVQLVRVQQPMAPPLSLVASRTERSLGTNTSTKIG